jgi:hypothetical protein
MMFDRDGSAGLRRRWATKAAVTMATVAAALIGAAPSFAAPKGAFAAFSDCPTSVPGVTVCTFAQTTSGEFTIGKTTVPINKTITLQGGAIKSPNPAEENTLFLIPAKDGNSLSQTELNVPGGLLDLFNCPEIGNFFARVACEAVFENGFTGVSATTELVANEKDPAILNAVRILEESGVALTLPVRVHLKNPLLGGSCYLGSEANPVRLGLTSGTTSPPPPNTPIKGKKGTFSVEEGSILVAHENSLVDNSYAVPGAEGCGGLFAFAIDPLLDAKIGLPSAAGSNTAVLNGTLKIAPAAAVVASET